MPIRLMAQSDAVSVWIRRWAPAILWAALIWFFSTRYFSSEDTASWIEPILRRIVPSLSKEALELVHYVVRKAAHFAEYFIFSVLIFRALRGDRRDWRLKWALAALAIAACYAGFDEIHQALVSKRAASVWDSLLDASGAFAAQLVEWVRMRKPPRALEKEPAASG